MYWEVQLFYWTGAAFWIALTLILAVFLFWASLTYIGHTVNAGWALSLVNGLDNERLTKIKKAMEYLEKNEEKK